MDDESRPLVHPGHSNECGESMSQGATAPPNEMHPNTAEVTTADAPNGQEGEDEDLDEFFASIE